MSRRVNTGCRGFDPLGCMTAFLGIRRQPGGDQPSQGYNDNRFFAKRFRPSFPSSAWERSREALLPGIERGLGELWAREAELRDVRSQRDVGNEEDYLS